MDLMKLQEFETLGPFEIKDELIKLARKTSRTTQIGIPQCWPRQSELDRHHSARRLLSARSVRVTESKRVMEHPAGVGGMPQPQGIAGRCEAWLAKHADMPVRHFSRRWCRLR